MGKRHDGRCTYLLRSIVQDGPSVKVIAEISEKSNYRLIGIFVKRLIVIFLDVATKKRGPRWQIYMRTWVAIASKLGTISDQLAVANVKTINLGLCKARWSHDKSLIRVRVVGVFLESHRNLLHQAMAVDANECEVQIVDLREATICYEPRPSQTLEWFSSIAYVCRDEQLALVADIASRSVMYGCVTRSFSEYEEALLWCRRQIESDALLRQVVRVAPD